MHLTQAYGSPDDLKQLVDTAHGFGLMVFLDVVYNHFGPDGNYLHTYAPAFFREDVRTPWGAAIDFRRPEVSDYFALNAEYWLREYRFDGLRFDAVHAIDETAWLPVMAERVRSAIERDEPGRFVHLVLENDDNDAALLERGFNAQWNDDAHHVLHVMLTQEQAGYYADFTHEPAHLLARALSQGFIYQGQASANREGKPRGSPSASLPPSAFVFFLQNHDQAGNRALGERLITLSNPDALRAAVGLQLLSPHIPLVFMGEEFGCRTPFLYFTSHTDPALAQAVRDGRRREFAGFFQAYDQKSAEDLVPDPNALQTFEASRPVRPDDSDSWARFYRDLLNLRAEHIVPRLPKARSLRTQVLGPAAVVAQWLMGDRSVLSLAINLHDASVAFDWGQGRLLVRCGARVNEADNTSHLPGNSLIALLDVPS